MLIYGIPTEIVTDHGSNVMSDIFKRICKLFKIDKICTTACHSVSNGALERTHKTLANYLRCFCDTKLNTWDEWLPFASFTYNTRHTLYEVQFRRIANIPGKLERQLQPLYNFDIVLKKMQRQPSANQLAIEYTPRSAGGKAVSAPCRLASPEGRAGLGDVTRVSKATQ
jgi:hypothetical protein